jgi:hypothetical protein
MRVICVEAGFYKGQLRQPCEFFDFAEEDMAKDEKGKPKLPSWVYQVRTEAIARNYVLGLLRMKDRDFIDGAIAASAPGARAKVAGTFLDAMDALTEPKRG